MTSPYPLSSSYGASSTMHSSTMGHSSGAGGGPPPPPRHRRAPSETDGDALDVEALERENFDLKMRLYYLEEKGAAGAGVPAQLYAALMRAGELQSALSRAEEEVEGKNTLLLKARGVIEALQAEAQSSRHSFAMERAAMQAEANERAHAAAVGVESQAHAARAQAQEAQARRMAAEEECAQLRLVLQSMESTTAHAAQEHSATLEHVRALNAQLESAHAATAAVESRYASLESQLSEWQREVSAREEAYKSAHAQLDDLTREVEELRPAQGRADAAIERAHGLEMALQAAQSELARTESEAAHKLQATQAAIDAARSDDERRLLAAHAADKEALVASHAAALAAQEDSARAAFAELQDAYTAQQLESKAAHESHLEAMRAEYEAALEREGRAARDRAQEAALRFEHELATKGAAFDAALRELEQSMGEANARALEDSERAHAEELRALQSELDQVRTALREESAAAHSAADAHRQALALLEQQLSNSDIGVRKDLDQAARIHSMELEREREKLAEAQARWERERADMERSHSDALAAARSDSERGEADWRSKESALLSSVEAQWAERESALRTEAERRESALRAEAEQREASLRADAASSLAHASQELEFVRTNVVRVLRSQLDQVESSLAREYAPLARVDEALSRERAAQEALRETRTRLADKQNELDRVRGDCVPVAKMHEAEDALQRSQRDLAAVQSILQRVQQTWTAHQRSQNGGAGAGAGIVSTPSPSNHSHAHAHSLSPILHLSMYPASSSSSGSAPVPMVPGTVSPSSSFAASFESLLSAAIASPAPGAAAGAGADLKPQLRKLQAENRALLSQVSSLRARLAAEVAEREESFVERAVATDAAEELQAVQTRLARRDTEMRQLRDLLVVARFPSAAAAAAQSAGFAGGVELMREMGAASGIEITSLSGGGGGGNGGNGNGASSPPRSPSSSSHSRTRARTSSHGSFDFPAPPDFSSAVLGSSVEELSAEVARLTRALKTRTAELAASQSRLRASKDALEALQDSTVERAVAAELEAALDASSKELASRESRIAALSSQLDQQGAALAEAERTAHELRSAIASQRAEASSQLASLQSEAEEHVRAQRAHYESLLGERDAALERERQRDSRNEAARTEQVERDRAALVEAHKRALERLGREHDANVAEAARVAESLRSELAQAATRVQRVEEDKTRLEQVVGSIAAQLLELTAAAAFSPIEHPPPPAAAAAASSSSSSNLRSSPHHTAQSHSRTPARAPPSSATSRLAHSIGGHNTTRGALFSPGNGAGMSHLGALFSPIAAPAAASGASAAATAAASPAHAPFHSLSMSPQQQQQQQHGDASYALSVSPQLSTISQCLTALAEHASAFQGRLCEFEEAYATLEALRLQNDEAFAEAQKAAAQEQARLAEELRRAQEQGAAALQSGQHEAKLREQQWRHEHDTMSRALQGAEENLALKNRAIEQATRAVDEAQLEAQNLRQGLAAANQRAEQARAETRAAEEARSRSEARLAAAEAALAAAPTSDAQQHLQERVQALQGEIARLEASCAAATQRLSEAESDRASLASLRLAHSALQQAHDKVLAAAEIDADERRVVSLQLEQARAIEADHALLQQRLAQAERRTQIVGADQQLNVQVTRRVLLELCEVLHAAKIPPSTYSDAQSSRTPSFLLGGTFHYPDDAEQAVKWIRAKVHEMQRVRRAFEYTISEVEEKWKGNFLKLQTLLEQRGSEIALLQRRLLTALGQKATVTGVLKWK